MELQRAQNVKLPAATLATPVGRGAIATILLQGDNDIIEIVQQRFRPASGKPLAPTSAIVFGHWTHAENSSRDGQPIENHVEDVVITISNRSPRDQTPTTSIEIQCHGGDQATTSILDSLESLGVTVVDWRTYIERQATTLESEHISALAKAATVRCAQLLVSQVQPRSLGPSPPRGAHLPQGSRLLECEINRITDLLADQNRDGYQETPGSEAHLRITDLLKTGELGKHLTQPWQIAVVGEPNVGKSSLMNALVGYERSIVYDQPGTTRDELGAELALDGWPVQVWDTAGIRDTTNEIEKAGVSRALARLKEADLVLEVRDVRELATPNRHSDQAAENANASIVPYARQKVLVAYNKIDLLELELDALPRMDEDSGPISATLGTGLKTLKHKIARTLVPNPPTVSTPLLFTERQIDLTKQALSALNAKDVRQCVRLLRQIVD